MKNLLICIVLICGIACLAAETVTVNSSESAISNLQIKSQITQHLQSLESTYLSQLNKTDQRNATELLNEIRGLLSLLPEAAGNQTNININLNNPDICPPQKPISDDNFAELRKSLYAATFDDTAVKILRSTAKDNYFLVSQIISILQILSFSEEKAEALFVLYPRCIDKENKFKLLNSFTFDNDKDKVADFLEAN